LVIFIVYKLSHSVMHS